MALGLLAPIRKREKFGNWLNVVSDDNVAIGVLGTSPYESVDAREQKGAMILYIMLESKTIQ